MMRLLRTSLLSISGVLSLAACTQASIVDLQIIDTSGDGHPTLAVKSGAAAIGSSSDPNWNVQNASSGGFTTPSLPTTSGDATNVTVSLAGAGGSFYQGVTTDPLLESYAVGLNSTTGSITGLTAGNTYDIYFYGSNGRGSVGSTFTIGTTSLKADGTNTGTIYHEGSDYVHFSVVPSSDTLNFSESVNSDSPAGTCCYILNGVQISGTFTPEPATLSLLGLPLLGLLAKRRRH